MAACRTSKDTSSSQTVETTTMPFVRGLLQGRGLSENASNIIQQSWRPGTTKQYKSYLLRWENYCREKKINSLAGTVIGLMIDINTQKEVHSCVANLLCGSNNE